MSQLQSPIQYQLLSSELIWKIINCIIQQAIKHLHCNSKFVCKQ